MESANRTNVDATVSYDVFISHKSEYRPWVEWLARALMANGHSVFLDIWNLVPGDRWVEGLHRGLECCRAAVLVATPEVVNSGWVRQEYDRLVQRRIADSSFRLVPLIFGDIPNLPFLAGFLAVDFRDTARYRDSFYRLLCGLQGREPGPSVALPHPIESPPRVRGAAIGAVVPGEEKFVQRVMDRSTRRAAPPLLIAARGRRYQGPVIQALLERARDIYGAGSILHVTPPFSEQASSEALFRELGRQCAFDSPTPDAIAFGAAFDRRLHAGARLFLLVTGFEHANSAGRKDIAGVLRTMTELQPEALRVVLVGGERVG